MINSSDLIAFLKSLLPEDKASLVQAFKSEHWGTFKRVFDAAQSAFAPQKSHPIDTHMKILRIVKFEFENRTTILVPVDAYDPNGKNGKKDFNQMVEEAKQQGWAGDEAAGRNGLVSVSLGDFIRVPDTGVDPRIPALRSKLREICNLSKFSDGNSRAQVTHGLEELIGELAV